MKVVIIGGVAGGMSAATRLRRRAEDAQIVVLERGEHVSFANCGLPYYVGGVITERADLLLQTPESLAARFALDVRVRHEVTAIDLAAKVVRGVRGPGREPFEEGYDALVLAPGAAPFVPDAPGMERALVLRDIADVDRMARAVNVVAQERGAGDQREAGEPGAVGTRPSAVVIGAGFIGLEVVENLVERGFDVAVVELADQVLAPLDPEMAVLVADRLTERGAALHLGRTVAAADARSVVLDDGTELSADVLVAALGVRPDTGFAAAAGLEVDERGGLLVDERHRTSDPAVFAVGDAVVKRDAIGGGLAHVPLAQTANRHGRTVADVLTGRDVTSPPVLGTAIVGLFGLQVASTGWNEKRLRAAGRPYRAIHTHPANHAGYYPGAEGMSLKLLVDPATDAILGAQGVGGTGVDKRIDVIATAMRGGLTATDLSELELAYAPQFGSAKDPVNMLGMIADNLATGLVRTVQWHELDAAVAAGAQVVDVRSAGEYAGGSLPGAVNVPVDELRARVGEIEKDRPVVVHCQVGLRGSVAARVLDQLGYDVVNLDGGYRTWRDGTRATD